MSGSARFREFSVLLHHEADTTWMAEAACHEADPADFFPENPGPQQGAVARALNVCRSCPVKDRCLQYALALGETTGVWGGIRLDTATRTEIVGRQRLAWRGGL